MIELALFAALMVVATATHIGIAIGVACATATPLSRARLVSTIAMLSGALVQGSLMERAVFSTDPIAALATLIVLVLGALLKVPISVNFTFFAAQLGLYHGLTLRTIVEMLRAEGAWIVCTLFAALAAYALRSLILLVASRSSTRAPYIVSSRLGIELATYTVAFSMGANTLGYILSYAIRSCRELDPSVVLLVLMSAALLSCLVLGKKFAVVFTYSGYALTYTAALGAIASSALAIQLATWLAIPMSSTLVLAVARASVARDLSPRLARFVALQLSSAPLGAAISIVLKNWIC